jgi:hypothetical protein
MSRTGCTVIAAWLLGAACSGGSAVDAAPQFDAPTGPDASADAATADANVGDASVDATGSCVPPLAECNGITTDGCESNLDSDPLDCGSCGHDCLGGACAAGVCQSFVLTTSVPRLQSLAIDASYVYWTSRGSPSVSFANGAVNRMSKDGGPWTAIAADQREADELLVAGDEIYWGVRLNASSSSIRYLSATSLGAPVDVATGQVYVFGIAVDATHVYWTDAGTVSLDYADGALRRAPRTGGMVETLLSDLDLPHAVAVSADEIYWSTLATPVGMIPGGLFRMPKAGGTVENLLGPVEIYGMVADTANVWATHAGTPAATFTDGALYRIPLGGAAVIAAGSRGRPWGVASDGTSAFWCDNGTPPVFDDGGIFSHNPGDGATATVDGDAAYPEWIQVDDEAVYWAVLTAPEVYSIYKRAR